VQQPNDDEVSEAICQKFSPDLWNAAADEALRRAAVEVIESNFVLAFRMQARAELFRRNARTAETRKELSDGLR
jgi:hypothetical protein